jgi:hypothetical protein
MVRQRGPRIETVSIEEITETEEKTTNACADYASWSGGNGLVDVRTPWLASGPAEPRLLIRVDRIVWLVNVIMMSLSRIHRPLG